MLAVSNMMEELLRRNISGVSDGVWRGHLDLDIVTSSPLVTTHSWNYSIVNVTCSQHSTLYNVSGSKPWPLLKQPVSLVVLLVIAYVTVFIVSLTSNCLVIDVIRRNAKLHSVTNCFLANLAIADVLVTVLVLPVTLLASIFTGSTTDFQTKL